MVWARAKLAIQDELLKPKNRVEIRFTGANPEKFYHELPKAVASVFRIHSRDMQETKFVWSHGEPEKFDVEWLVTKELDFFSHYFLEISLKGSVSKGIGSAVVGIEGVLRTEYPQDTAWQRSFLYEILRMFWHKTFYVQTRDKFLAEGRRLMALLAEELRKLAKE